MARIAKAKPCPFCRSTDSYVECAYIGAFYRVCNSCEARGPVADGEDCDFEGVGGRNATRAWNRRSRKASLQAEQGAKHDQ